MFLIFSLLSVFLTTNFQGNSSKCNRLDNPCNYNIVQEQMTFGDTIIITDKTISDPEHLEAFHNLSSNAFLNGISMQGSNTTIDGKLSIFFHPSFIICETKYNVSIEFFIFINFAFPIIQCNENTKIKISNCDFSNNHVDNKFAILNFENSCTAVFDQTNFSILTSHDATIIFSNQSTLVFDHCTIDKSFLFHASKTIPLIMSIQSNLKILNSVVTQNQSPYSPFFILKKSSNILIENSSFSSNQNNNIFLLKDVNQIMIKNSFFYNNMGNFIANGEPNIELDIFKTHFEQNYSPIIPFFNIIDSSVKLYDHCTFISNSAHSSLFQIIGSKSLIRFNETQFSDNQIDDSIVKCMNKSEIHINSCEFNNSQSRKSVIMGSKSKLYINKTHFLKSWSPSIQTSNCELHVFNSIFDQSELHGKLSISSINSSFSQIINSSFRDRSFSHLIKMNGTVFLQNLDFNTNKEYALSKKLLKKCMNCSFLEEIIRDENSMLDFSFFLMITLSFFIFVLILIIFRKRISYFWRKCVNKRNKMKL